MTPTATASSSQRTCLAACLAKAPRLRWGQLLTALATTEGPSTGPMLAEGEMLQAAAAEVQEARACAPHRLPRATRTWPAAAWLQPCIAQAQAASAVGQRRHYLLAEEEELGSERQEQAAEAACESHLI